MKMLLLLGLTVLMAAVPFAAGAQEAAEGAPAAEALGWKLGCQAYSFNRFTFQDAVDKNASMGLRYIEAYPGQTLSTVTGDTKLHHTMSEEHRQLTLDYLKSKNVTLLNYGVVGLPNDEAECRSVFEFAKAMGIETIVSEPDPEAFDLLDKLTEEYGINVAIHNHPEPSRYYSPELVLEAVEGHSTRIGACADTGHWMRSGINPLDALKMLEGRIISFHFKDLNKYGRDGEHDVVWGQGEADVKALMEEIKRQGFEGMFAIEYEHNWENSVPDIAQCVEYFNQTAAELGQ